MGEIADMMLEGILCAGCGVAMDDVADDDFETPGYPRYCCNSCKPVSERAPPPKQQEIMRRGRGKKAQPYRYSIGSKVVHSVNSATGKSWCQFENNMERGHSGAFGGPPPIVEFEIRGEYASKRDCKNCAILSARSKATGAA